MSDTKIVDIQQIINNKADSKLKAAIKNINDIICNGEGYQLLKDIKINIGTQEKPKSIGLAWIFSSSGFESQIIENNTQRYREAEAIEFMQKVDSIREDVDNLLDSRNYD